MFRSTRIIKLDKEKDRICVRIESGSCEWGSMLCKERRQHLLASLAEDPNLLLCGDQYFQKMSLTHNGEKWIVEAEAVVDRRNI